MCETSLSLIVPAYNEQDNVRPFFDRAVSAFEDSGINLQIVFVDDGSKDRTYEQMVLVGNDAKALSANIEVVALSFSRNFGKEAALYAGLQHASGDFCCFIDSDLQQRPETAREMLEKLLESDEYDIVAAYQEKRGETPSRPGFPRYSMACWGSRAAWATLWPMRVISAFSAAR